MNRIKQQIPNFITLCNLICGCLAIIYFFQGYDALKSIWNHDVEGWKAFLENTSIKNGVFLILLAMVLDFLDGFTAKLLKVQSEIGAQLDSLADLVTFGVAPSILIYITLSLGFSGENIPYLFVLIPVFSAYRLAKFNVDDTQTENFKGMPTPANALFWIGMPYLVGSHFGILDLRSFFLVMIFILSFLMISNFEMFSLKIKHLRWKENEIRYLFIGVILLLLFYFMISGLSLLMISPLIILTYILFSIGKHFFFPSK